MPGKLNNPVEALLEDLVDIKQPIEVENLQQSLTAVAMGIHRSFNPYNIFGRRTNNGVKVHYSLRKDTAVPLKNPFEFVQTLRHNTRFAYPPYNVGEVIVARVFDFGLHAQAQRPPGVDSNLTSEYLPEPPTIAFTSGRENLWATFDPSYAERDVERSTVRAVEPDSPAAVVLTYLAQTIHYGVQELAAKPVDQ